MQKIIFNKTRVENLEEYIQIELTKLQENRKKELGQSVFIIFDADGDIESFNTSQMQGNNDFLVALKGPDKKTIKDRFQKIIDGTLASFALGTERIVGVKKVRDGVIFFNDEGTPIYSYTNKISGKMLFSIVLSEDILEFVRTNARSIGKHQKIVGSAILLTRSLDEEKDELESFLSAWSGLEIFIDKNFKDYEKILFEKFKGEDENPNAPINYLERIRGVMKDKYTLAVKFSVICFELSPDTAKEDIKAFEMIKKLRNNFIHEDENDKLSLLLGETQRLLRKYLKLHIQSLKK